MLKPRIATPPRAALCLLPLLLPGGGPSAATDPGRREALLQVEDQWLRAREAVTLERILAGRWQAVDAQENAVQGGGG